MINVLHVYPQLLFGGVERVIADIIRFSDASRFRHAILTQYPGENEEEFVKTGVEILRIPFDGGKIKYGEEVRNLFQNRHFDAVHCHSHREMYIVNQEAAKMGVPVRIAHSHVAHQDVKGIKRWLRILKFYHHRHGATDLIGCSRDALDWIFPLGGIRRLVIPNSIDSQRFRFSPAERKKLRNRYGISDSTRVILNVGRATEQKNQQLILKLAEAEEEADRLYVIIGHGNLLKNLKEDAERKKLHNVLFAKEYANIEEWFSAADIFIFPSLYEGNPLAPMEAQASGIPVIVSPAVSDEACLMQDLFFRMKSLRISEWLVAIRRIEEMLDAIEFEPRPDVSINPERESKTAIKRFEEIYSAPELIFAYLNMPGNITGGEIYDAHFAKVAEKLLDGATSSFIADINHLSASNKTGLSKWLIPFRTLSEVRKVMARYKRIGLKKPAWHFNSSKCIYFLPSLLYLHREGAICSGVTHHPLYLQMKGIKKWMYYLAEMSFLRLLNYCVVPSQYTRRLLAETLTAKKLVYIPIPFNKADPSQIEAQNNGGDDHKKRFAISHPSDSSINQKNSSILGDNSKKTCKFANNCVKIIFIGTIEPRKGIHYLIESLTILKRQGIITTLILIGKVIDLDYACKLRNAIEKRDLNVAWEGYVSEERKKYLLDSADILVLPSKAEGFGIVLVEAMAAGVPVVGFRNSGMIDVIGEKEQRGFLARDGDSESLATTIRLITENISLRNEKCEAAIRWVANLPSFEEFEADLKTHVAILCDRNSNNSRDLVS